MKIHKIRVESFEPYGLNKYKNFLDGNVFKAYIVDEIIGWAEGILTDIDIEEDLAIFIHADNDNMYAVAKIYDWEDEVFYIEKYMADANMDFFAQLDAEMNFAGYALVMQTGKTKWTVITL